jgi:hypothetical protein
VLAHLRVTDFSIAPGRTGCYARKVGLVGLWQKRFTRRPARPGRTKKQPEVKVGGQVISPDDMRGESRSARRPPQRRTTGPVTRGPNPVDSCQWPSTSFQKEAVTRAGPSTKW